MLENLTGIVNCAVACSLGTNKRAAVSKSLACNNAVFKCVCNSLILTEQEADFTSSYADIACGNVNIRSDMSVKLCHKRLTEAHNLLLALASRVKVRAALCTAHRKSCKRVLEGLLKAEEIHNA